MARAMPAISASLRAGLYPSAALPLRDVAEKYAVFRASPHGWMLNRLVLPAAKLAETPLGDGWRVSLAVDAEPGPLPPQVETRPTSCEAPLDQVSGAFAKVRTGGLTPDAIPPPAAIRRFPVPRRRPAPALQSHCRSAHPLRSLRPLTEAADSSRAVMHGFVNVFAGAAFAWHGTGRDAILDILTEEDPRAFELAEDALDWRGRRLSTAQIQTTRRDFANCFGSRSFEEPVADLRELRYLP